MSKRTYEQLKEMQGWDLEDKVILSTDKICEFYEMMNGQVYVSFSGGKDSTVLLHLVREVFPDVPAVFVDTGLEFPEVRTFVKTIPNVIWVKPELSFKRVLETEGYPVVSKKVAKMLRVLQNPTSNNVNVRRLYWEGITSDGRKCPTFKLPKRWRYLKDAPFPISEQCCKHLKHKPLERYEREAGLHPYIGTMASDSRQRQGVWLSHGCIQVSKTAKMSKPLSVWLNDDIWEYIKTRDIPYSSIYNMGYENTGCVFCAFGAHLDVKKGHPTKFQLMKETHPKLWAYCMTKLGMREVLKYLDIPTGEDD